MSILELNASDVRRDVETTSNVVLEDDTCTVISLTASLSQIDATNCYDLGCCDRCPNYTTVPCSC